MTDPIYKGFGYPIRRTSRGFFHQVEDTAVIKADLIQLLLTEPGERVMEPAFGTGLRSFIFEQGDDFLEEEVKNRIIQAIALWENRVEITDIQITIAEDGMDPLSDKTVKIQIDFRLKRDLNKTDSLRLSVTP